MRGDPGVGRTARVRRLVAVVADDLTGAADAAVPFALRGLEVAVSLDGTVRQDVEVLALVTDNRWRPPAEARDRMREAVHRIRRWGPQYLFVKVDSTLRGRVADDVASALRSWGGQALASPAFPGQGRVVRDGALVVHGRVAVDRVADRFPVGVEVADALTHQDLVALARDVVETGRVAVGSGGLSRALADVLVRGPARVDPAPAAPVAGVLVVVGTSHPVTAGQVARAAAAGAVVVTAGAGTQRAADAVCTAIRGGRPVILVPAPDAPPSPDSPEAASAVTQLGALVRDVLAAVGPLGLAMTGGATALAVAAALRAREFRLLSEVSEGLPVGELVTGSLRLPLITKAGGFGSLDCLLEAIETLQEKKA